MTETDNAQKKASLPWGESFDVSYRSTIWFNDLEKDRRYYQWPSQIGTVKNYHITKYFLANETNLSWTAGSNKKKCIQCVIRIGF